MAPAVVTDMGRGALPGVAQDFVVARFSGAWDAVLDLDRDSALALALALHACLVAAI
jgi:hypothetical protein